MEYLVAQLFAHALVNNHIASQLSGFLQVAACASCHSIYTVNQLLGHPATQHASQHILKLNNAVIAFVLRRDKPGDATGSAAGNNGDFVYHIAVW